MAIKKATVMAMQKGRIQLREEEGMRMESAGVQSVCGWLETYWLWDASYHWSFEQ